MLNVQNVLRGKGHVLKSLASAMLTGHRSVGFGVDGYLRFGSVILPYQVLAPTLPAVWSRAVTVASLPARSGSVETVQSGYAMTRVVLNNAVCLSRSTRLALCPPTSLHPPEFDSVVYQKSSRHSSDSSLLAIIYIDHDRQHVSARTDHPRTAYRQLFSHRYRNDERTASMSGIC